MAKSRRRFGWRRKLPSGPWQASYLGPDGQRRNAPHTFRTKGDAERWLTLVEAELERGQWTDPERQQARLAAFGDRWIAERPGLRPRTIDLYRWLFGKHVRPYLGTVRLHDLDAATVRQWRHGLLDAGVSATMAAKAYRLLRAILTTAVDDSIIARNPCRLRGAGSEPTGERPVLSVAQVFDLVDQMPPRYRMLVLVATFGSLRWGEVSALRRCDVDPDTGVLRVRLAFAERSTGEIVLGPPKSRAGIRAVTLPRPLLGPLATHLEEYGPADPAGLLFTGDKGGTLRRSNFNRRVSWRTVVSRVGVPNLHFHDLRHTGNTLAASSGASLRDLMIRMGHDSMRAALIYQHGTDNADQHIADALTQQIEAETRNQATDSDDGAPSGEQHADSTKDQTASSDDTDEGQAECL
jgi:integrase